MAKPTGKLIRTTPESIGALPSGGTAVAASKLAIARKINGVAFDGSADITLTPAGIGALTDAQAAQKYALRSIKINGKPLSADVNLLAGDVNAWNKTESDGRYLGKGETAAAATKLATPRKINGVPFDGTSDINISSAKIATANFGGASGWWKDNDTGIIRQWLIVQKSDIPSSRTEYNVIWPIAFPNAALFASLSTISHKKGENVCVVQGYNSLSKTGGEIYTEEWSAQTQNVAVVIEVVGY